MSQATDRYYVPHDSHWPVVGTVGLLFLMVGVSVWLNGSDPGFYIMLGGLGVVIFMLVGWFSDVIGGVNGCSGDFCRKMVGLVGQGRGDGV